MRCFKCRGTATETDNTCFVEYGVWKEETFEVEFNAPVYRCDKCNIIFVCEVIKGEQNEKAHEKKMPNL